MRRVSSGVRSIKPNPHALGDWFRIDADDRMSFYIWNATFFVGSFVAIPLFSQIVFRW